MFFLYRDRRSREYDRDRSDHRDRDRSSYNDRRLRERSADDRDRYIRRDRRYNDRQDDCDSQEVCSRPNGFILILCTYLVLFCT